MKKFSPSNIRSAIIAVTCSFIYGILLGTIRQTSLLFVASMPRFGVDRQQASLPFFLCYAIADASGPLVGFLGRKFGLKNVTTLGCLLSSIFVGGCFFAEDIIIITILWGVAFGLSLGMGCHLLPEVLSKHFSSHLDKAVGIALGGECIVSFLLTLLTEYLLKVYGLSGTFLILSGIVLHIVPASMLIQIPDHTKQNPKISEVSYRDSVFKCNLDKDSFLEKDKSIFIGKLEQKTNLHECTGNIVSTKQKTNRPECTGNDVSTIPISTKPKTSLHECTGNNVSIIPISTKQKSNTKSSIYGFRVFLNPTYLLILLTQGTFTYIYTSINTILVDISRDRGVALDDAVYVLISFQVADAVGRFTLGYFTDRGYLSKANFSAVCFAAIGLLLVAFIWMRGLTGMVIFVLALGIFVGGLKMISASIVMQYVEKDCFSIAVASRLTLYAPISFTQAPLIGFFRDKLKTYTGLVCILIAMSGVNCIIYLIIPPLERNRQKRKKDSQVTTNICIVATT